MGALIKKKMNLLLVLMPNLQTSGLTNAIAVSFKLMIWNIINVILEGG
jgi:hypothetical protein